MWGKGSIKNQYAAMHKSWRNFCTKAINDKAKLEKLQIQRLQIQCLHVTHIHTNTHMCVFMCVCVPKVVHMLASVANVKQKQFIFMCLCLKLKFAYAPKSRSHSAGCQTDRPADRHTDRQPDRLTGASSASWSRSQSEFCLSESE